MADLKKLTDDATTKAVLALGRDAARRAVDDALLSDEEKAARASGELGGAKKTRWKLYAFGVIGFFLFVGLVGAFLNFWYWFLALGVLGVLALYAWRKLRGRFARKTTSAPSSEAVEAPVRTRVEPETVADAPAGAIDARAQAAERRAELEARARAAAEARVVAEQEVDEELAALKARMKK